MDKEMMAKVNEVMKANGKRELSMDELDKVVGGSIEKGVGPGTIIYNGGLIGEAEFNAIYISLTKNVSFDVAIQVLQAETGFWCTQMRGVGNMSSDPVNDINVVLNDFWRVVNEHYY